MSYRYNDQTGRGEPVRRGDEDRVGRERQQAPGYGGGRQFRQEGRGYRGGGGYHNGGSYRMDNRSHPGRGGREFQRGGRGYYNGGRFAPQGRGDGRSNYASRSSGASSSWGAASSEQRKQQRLHYEQGGRGPPRNSHMDTTVTVQNRQAQQQEANTNAVNSEPQQPSQQQESYKIPVPEEAWKSLDRKLKMNLLLPLERDLIYSVILNEFPEDFPSRCERAVQKLLSDLPRLWREFFESHHVHQEWDDDEGYDSDELDIDGMPPPNMDPNRGQNMNQSPPTKFIAFIKALPECVALDFGFHVLPIQSKHTATCYCPCRKKMRESWQVQCNLVDVTLCVTSKGGDKGFMDHALVQHCREKAKQCFYHKLVLEYIQNLYNKYHTRSTDHKALYCVNDSDYQRAEAEQTRAAWKKLKKAERERDEARQEKEEMKKQLEELQKVNPNKAEVVQAKLTAMQRFEAELKLEPKPRERMPSKSEISGCQARFDKVFDHCRRCSKKCRCKPTCKSWKCKKNPSLMFQELPQRFSLQEEWIRYTTEKSLDEKQQSKMHGTPLAPLFFDKTELNEFHFKPADRPSDESDPIWLFNWDVQFQDVDGVKGETSDKAKDKGGPTRVLLGEVWRQFGDVNLLEQTSKAKTEETSGSEVKRKPVYIFEPKGGSLWPQIDDRLLSGVSRPNIEILGRAIGRTILHTISNRLIDPDNDEDPEVSRFTIAGHLLPPPYRRYLLQGIKPTDERYEIRDLFTDFLDYTITENVDEWKCEGDDDDKYKAIMERFEFLCDGYDVNEGTMEQKLRKATEAAWIDSRSIVLDSIKEGLGVGNGNHQALEIAGMALIDMKMMDLLFFSKLHITSEDVINALEPALGNEAMSKNQRAIISVKDGKIEGHLVDLLRKREEDDTDNSNFAGDFVEFATGSRHLPQNGATIIIEFCFEEAGYSGDPESLPVAHTCHQTVKLPSQAYEGKFSIFEKKLDLALAEGLKNLTMT